MFLSDFHKRKFINFIINIRNDFLIIYTKEKHAYKVENKYIFIHISQYIVYICKIKCTL